jgi:hypothetical protein
VGRQRGQAGLDLTHRDLVVDRVDRPPAQRIGHVGVTGAVGPQQGQLARQAQVGDVAGAVAEAVRQPAGQMPGQLRGGEHLGHPGAPAHGRGRPDALQHRVVAVPGGLRHGLDPFPGQLAAQRGQQRRLERIGADLGLLTGHGHGCKLGPADGRRMNAGLPAVLCDPGWR